MAVTNQPLYNGSTRRAIPTNRIAAVLIWIVGVGTTYACISTLLPGVVWYVPLGVSAITQLVLTLVESPALNLRPDLPSVIALVMDVLLNVGGLFFPLMRLGETGVGKAIATAFNVPPQMTGITTFILAALLGFVLSAAPEKIWNSR